MGTFWHPIDLGDPTGQRFETLDALVDTDAAYSVVPASILRRLGVNPHTRETFLIADGSRVARDIGRTWVRINDKSEITLVIFGDEALGPVLGAYTLEGLGLAVDPVNRRLVPAELYLLPCVLARATA